MGWAQNVEPLPIIYSFEIQLLLNVGAEHFQPSLI